jgi:tetraacyldisaccharide 4'-kinase
LWRKDLQKIAYQKVYFTRSADAEAVALCDSGRVVRKGDDVICMAGIGNPRPFVRSMRRRFNVVSTIKFPDHHVYTVADIETIVARLRKYPNAVLLTTEKDMVKLHRSRRVPDFMRERLFYMPLSIEFIEGSDDDFLGTLRLDLEGKLHLDSAGRK